MYHATKPFTPEPNASDPITPAESWHNAIQLGDVVQFRFPFNEEHKTDKPKKRPCLVLDVFDLNGTKFVELAYGTSARTSANKGYEVRVNQPASCVAAGLDRPSRFVCARRVIVSVKHSGFLSKDERCTLIGHLDPQLIERMNALLIRLQTEQDVLFEALQDRQGEQGSGLPEDRGFLLRNRDLRAPKTPQKIKGDLK
jgi:hypothetical protein